MLNEPQKLRLLLSFDLNRTTIDRKVCLISTDTFLFRSSPLSLNLIEPSHCPLRFGTGTNHPRKNRHLHAHETNRTTIIAVKEMLVVIMSHAPFERPNVLKANNDETTPTKKTTIIAKTYRLMLCSTITIKNILNISTSTGQTHSHRRKTTCAHTLNTVIRKLLSILAILLFLFL